MVKLVFQSISNSYLEKSSEKIKRLTVFALSVLRLVCPPGLKTAMHPASYLNLIPGQEYFEQMGQPKGGFPIQTCVKRTLHTVTWHTSLFFNETQENARKLQRA